MMYFYKDICFLIVLCLLIVQSRAFKGLDISIPVCKGLTLEDWQCLRKENFTFAIIETFDGGPGQNPAIATCVSDAWKAGFLHVDVVRFCHLSASYLIS